MSLEARKTFAHLQKTNEDIFDETDIFDPA